MHTYIIAEAGVNHNGNIELAKKLIDVAAEAGADAVKFQTFNAKKVVCKTTKKANYQQKNTEDSNASQLEMLKALELSQADHRILLEYCHTKNIEFLSTPFDLTSIEFLQKLGLKKIKIASSEITNLPYLEKIGQLNLEVILSTGMSLMAEVKAALDILISSGTKQDKIIVLHANTQYPTPMCDVNLKAMVSIREELKVSVGYSDHTLGIEIPIAAVALGAVVIEKHITIDKTLPGPDHKASIEPSELKAMVNAIRSIEVAMGNGTKEPSSSEKENIDVARKSIVAKTDILQGDILSEINLTTKRPGTGISPMRWFEVLGQKAQKDYKQDDLI